MPTSHCLGILSQLKRWLLSLFGMLSNYMDFLVPLLVIVTKYFLADCWTELFWLQGTSLYHNTTYHPQTVGQTKVVNRCVETYLRCFSYNKPRRWSTWLPWAEYWYNTTFHSSTNTTPFQAVYGRDPPLLLRFGSDSTSVLAVDQLLQERDLILNELKDHLCCAQSKMKSFVSLIIVQSNLKLEILSI